MIARYSSTLKARIVSARKLPCAPRASATFAMVSSSGASSTRQCHTAHRQVPTFQLHTQGLTGLFRRVEPCGTLFDALDALLGKADQRHIGWHGIASCSCIKYRLTQHVMDPPRWSSGSH